MSLLLALALAGAADAAAPDRETEIVVLGRKLKDWRGSFRTKKGQLICKTTQSTGDGAIDAVGCSAMEICVTPHVAAMQAIANSREPKDERNRRMNALMQTTLPCMMQQRKEGIAALADRRAAEAAR